MGHYYSQNSEKNLRLAFFINLCFTIIEIIGGGLTNSVAIISDALRDLGDSLSLGLVWYIEGKAKKRPQTNLALVMPASDFWVL